jgi:hypothetical protein
VHQFDVVARFGRLTRLAAFTAMPTACYFFFGGFFVSFFGDLSLPMTSLPGRVSTDDRPDCTGTRRQCSAKLPHPITARPG